MEEKEFSKYTDEELLQEAKKMKKSAVMSALLIGFMVGVIIFSAVKSTWGLVTLIPLFFIYKLTKKSDRDEALKKLLKERNLKY